MRTVLLVESEGHSENTGVELKIIGDGIINLVDKQETRSFRFSTGQTAETVYLYTDLTGIFPEKIYISAAGSGFDLLSAKLTEPASADKVRPADIGISSSPSSSREKAECGTYTSGTLFRRF